MPKSAARASILTVIGVLFTSLDESSMTRFGICVALLLSEAACSTASDDVKTATRGANVFTGGCCREVCFAYHGHQAYSTASAIQVRTTINQLPNKISAYLLHQFLDN
jgi:hypothetical protein